MLIHVGARVTFVSVANDEFLWALRFRRFGEAISLRRYG